MELASQTRFTQAMNPALRKLALMMLLAPEATFADLTDAMRRLPSCDVLEARRRLERYEDERIELEIKRGRLRADLPPARRTTPGAVPATRVEEQDVEEISPASRG